jgi:hypothetical protein
MHAKPIAKSVLLVGAVLCVLGIVLGLVAFLQGPPEPAPTQKTLEQPLAADASSSPDATLEGAGLLDVLIELEAGEFHIEPTSLGKSIQVHAEYDESLYELEQEFDASPSGGGHFVLRYGSRGNWRHLRRGLGELRKQLGSRDEPFEDVPSRVDVELPMNVPMRLELRLEKGMARVDLTGLSLHHLMVDHAMGELELRIDEPNPVPMDELVLHSKMGEARVSGLGNAAVSILEFRGRMGSFELDFDGAWETDLQTSVAITMGDVLLRVPRDVWLDMSNRHVLFGSLDSSYRSPPPSVEATPPMHRFTLETAVRLGNLQIR